MLPESIIAGEIENANLLLLADLKALPHDMPQDALESAVAAHAAMLFRLVASVTRSVDRAELEERKFLNRVRALDADDLATKH